MEGLKNNLVIQQLIFSKKFKVVIQKQIIISNLEYYRNVIHCLQTVSQESNPVLLFTVWATGEALYKNSCKGKKKKTQIKGNWWPSHSSGIQF